MCVFTGSKSVIALTAIYILKSIGSSCIDFYIVIDKIINNEIKTSGIDWK